MGASSRQALLTQSASGEGKKRNKERNLSFCLSGKKTFPLRKIKKTPFRASVRTCLLSVTKEEKNLMYKLK